MSNITLNLTLPLTDDDRAMLSALAAGGPAPAPSMPLQGPPEPVKVTEKPAPKAKAAPKAKPEPKAEAKPEPEPKAEAKPEPEPEKAPAPKAETKPAPKAETGGKAAVDDAVARASALLSAGQAARVKEALEALDIQRVSQLKPSQVSDFLKALED